MHRVERSDTHPAVERALPYGLKTAAAPAYPQRAEKHRAAARGLDFPETLPGKRSVGLRSGLEGLNVGYSIHQQHTKKKDQIEHGKHEQATRRLPFLVMAPTYLP
jgi:hypothetical protein